MSGREKLLLENALDSLDRLFDGHSSVLDVQALLFATGEALRDSAHLAYFERPAAELSAAIRSGESEDAKRGRAVAATDGLRHYLADLLPEP